MVPEYSNGANATLTSSLLPTSGTRSTSSTCGAHSYFACPVCSTLCEGNATPAKHVAQCFAQRQNRGECNAAASSSSKAELGAGDIIANIRSSVLRISDHKRLSLINSLSHLSAMSSSSRPNKPKFSFSVSTESKQSTLNMLFGGGQAAGGDGNATVQVDSSTYPLTPVMTSQSYESGKTKRKRRKTGKTDLRDLSAALPFGALELEVSTPTKMVEMTLNWPPSMTGIALEDHPFAHSLPVQALGKCKYSLSLFKARQQKRKRDALPPATCNAILGFSSNPTKISHQRISLLSVGPEPVPSGLML